MKNTNKNHQKHIPVLLDEVLTYLDPKPGENYLDLTSGYGGHASAVLERTLGYERSVLVDRDDYAIEHLSELFATTGVEIIKSDFLKASKELLERERLFDLILADLGVSSPHLDNASRGFSFREEGPLDMRMDQKQEITAADVVNNYSQDELEFLIRQFGEDPRAKRIAQAIVAHRPIETTQQLARIIAQTIPGYSKIHPATQTFQALRIVVNSELDQIRQALPIWIELLRPGGRVAVISFHSLEDRIVKQIFQDNGGNRYDSRLTILTKNPVTASTHELVSNPRSRSAKLRVAAKK